jgi:hypothetical protein
VAARDDFAATIQRQIQQAQANQQRGGGGEEDSQPPSRGKFRDNSNIVSSDNKMTATITTKPLECPQQVSAAPGPPSQQNGNDTVFNLQMNNIAIRRLVYSCKMLAGRLSRAVASPTLIPATAP